MIHLFVNLLFAYLFSNTGSKKQKTVGLGSTISSATVLGVTGHAGLEREEESLKIPVQVNERNPYFVGMSS